MTLSTAVVPTLADLQQWDREDWKQYDPCLWGGTPSQKRVVETIIRAADRELTWQGEQNANSLRDFWYNPTKPILQRAFPEKVDEPGYDFNRQMSQTLSGVLSGLVKDGEITYRSLNILDDSRDRQLQITSPESDKILFVEKNAAYRKVKPLETVYELSIVSGGGWQATALIEDLAHELPDRSYTVYLLTDYDPTGWKIGRDFSERSAQLGLEIDEIQRVGILPDQLGGETIRRQRFEAPVNSDADREWMDTRAIDGQYGLEIEALGDLNSKGQALRRMVVDHLRDDIRVRKRRLRDVCRGAETAASQATERVMHTITDDLKDVVGAAVVDVLNARDGVDATTTDAGVEVDADLSTAEAGREWLPTPYDPEDLHTSAVDGEPPETNHRQVTNFLTDQVWQQIQAGEIDLAEHLGLEVDQ
jgi:5S rRNA maturation endonuclease (ribonuclease M5)